MHILIVTSEWPRYSGDISGIYTYRQVQLLEQRGHNIDVFSFRGRKNPLRYISFVPKLWLKLRTGYDIIHAHDTARPGSLRSWQVPDPWSSRCMGPMSIASGRVAGSYRSSARCSLR